MTVDVTADDERREALLRDLEAAHVEIARAPKSVQAHLVLQRLLTAAALLHGGTGHERGLELYQLDLAWHRRELQ